MASAPLIPEQRQARVLAALRRDGIVSIRSLAEALDVSHMTIRRDISQLESDGLVVGVKGGVRLVEAEAGGHGAPLDHAARIGLELPRKRAIAGVAARQVEDGSVIYLDAGTTTHSLVPLLAGVKELTVVTNDFLIVNSLFREPGITTIHTGGNVDPAAGCAQGLLAAETVSRLNIDTYFVSTAGWSINKGVSSPSSDKALLKQAVLSASTRSVLLADSTKYGASSMVKVFGLERLDLIVTDAGLAAETADDLRQLGVDLELAPFR